MPLVLNGKARLIAKLRREALAECERCQGRVHGDCCQACRYWSLTATEAERRAVEKP